MLNGTAAHNICERPMQAYIINDKIDPPLKRTYTYKNTTKVRGYSSADFTQRM